MAPLDMHVCMYVCMLVGKSECMYVYMYVCTYALRYKASNPIIALR